MLTFLTLLACTDTKTTDTAPATELGSNGIIMAMVAMDYSVGALATFDLDSQTLTENIASVSGDPVIIMDGGWLWQLNRYQYDTLRKYDPENLQVPVAEVSLASDVGSSNPHDVAVCNDQLFVSLYGENRIPILDQTSLEQINDIDISEWSDADGTAEASSMVVVDDQLYVGLQRLDRNNGFEPGTSVTLQIDCPSQRVINNWEMGSNVELVEWDDSVAMVTQATDSLEAGVLAWNGTDWNRVWTANSAMSSVEYKDNRLFYSSLNASQTEYVLHCVDVNSGTQSTSDAWSEYITDLLIEDSTTGWVGAHWGWSAPSNSNPGLYQIDLETCTVNEFWATELGPFSMTIVK